MIASGFYFHAKFLERLKNCHPSLYSQLGEPGVFTKYPVSEKSIVRDLSPNKSLTKYTEFMSSKKWRGLNDGELNKFARYRKFTQFFAAALFIMAFMGVEPRP